ncbi:MAG TPA: NRDE family protein [Steroidobacteraceae bacterium]|nr:NRDE family protein [Steroidobacteraceae bacterium]
MCLLVLAWNVHPRYRLVVAANRDEFHDRPAAPLDWWRDVPGVLAGRDLRGAGTWMGVSRSGRFGVVTNYRDLEPAPAPDAPSRGELVPKFLVDDAAPRGWLEALRSRAGRYAGFNLLLATDEELFYFSNRNGLEPQPLSPGLYGLSNHLLDSPWPKLLRARERLRELVTAGPLEAEALFALLADRTPADADAMPATGLPPDWERALSAPFVVHDRYGTRCSTVLLVERHGGATTLERRFDASGIQTGASRWQFDVCPPSRTAASAAVPERAALREPTAAWIE